MTPRTGKAFRPSLLELEDRRVPSVTATADPVAPGQAPNVVVRDADGAVVATIAAYEPGMTAGVRVTVEDLNRDGVPDIVTSPAEGGGPRVRVFDGVTFAGTADFYAYDPDFRGGVSVTAGPLGGGLVGIATGAGLGGGPHVRVFTPSGSELAGFYAGNPAGRDGVEVFLAARAGEPVALVTSVSGRTAAFDPTTGAAVGQPDGSWNSDTDWEDWDAANAVADDDTEIEPGPFDMNGDGETDGVVLDENGDGLADPSGLDGDCHGGGFAVDLDGDGEADGGGLDLDDDGAIDSVGIDEDGDGAIDGIDTDGDGEIDGDLPPCGGGGGGLQPGEFDLNGDGLPDGSTVDEDGDGEPDMVDTNGDGIPDSLAVDTDGDGIADASGPDLDGDGLPDGLNVDTNGDGIPDGIDTDGDGESDGTGVDLDGDGVPDAVGSDTDGDGDIDSLDTDGDGESDGGAIDSDGDGVIDGIDTDGDGIADDTDDTDDPVSYPTVRVEVNNTEALTDDVGFLDRPIEVRATLIPPAGQSGSASTEVLLKIMTPGESGGLSPSTRALVGLSSGGGGYEATVLMTPNTPLQFYVTPRQVSDSANDIVIGAYVNEQGPPPPPPPGGTPPPPPAQPAGKRKVGQGELDGVKLRIGTGGNTGSWRSGRVYSDSTPQIMIDLQNDRIAPRNWTPFWVIKDGVMGPNKQLFTRVFRREADPLQSGLAAVMDLSGKNNQTPALELREEHFIRRADPYDPDNQVGVAKWFLRGYVEQNTTVQTAPGFADSLTLGITRVALEPDPAKAGVRSQGFSVAAIPEYDSSAFTSLITVGANRGINVRHEHRSDSGVLDDLNRVDGAEVVQTVEATGVFVGVQSNPSSYLPMNVPANDQHTSPAVFLAQQGTRVVHQITVFRDARTGAGEVPMKRSGFIVNRRTGNGQLLIQKYGARVTVAGGIPTAGGGALQVTGSSEAASTTPQYGISQTVNQ